MRLNQFLKVEPPPTRILVELEKRLLRFQEALEAKSYLAEDSKYASEEIAIIAQSLDENEFLDPIERGVSALLAFHNYREPAVVETVEEEILTTELNIFVKIRISDSLRKLLLVDDIEAFGQPILIKAETRAAVEIVERASGKLDKQASNIANEIVSDMQLATFYPPKIVETPTVPAIIAKIQGLNTRIQEARMKAKLKTTDKK
jgi:intracellular multiplication protein IcmO